MGPPQRTIHSCTEHPTLTCTTATVFLISVLVSGIASYNWFSTQQPTWYFKNRNQIMLVSLKIFQWLPLALPVKSKHPIVSAICLSASLIFLSYCSLPHPFHSSYSVVFCCSNTSPSSSCTYSKFLQSWFLLVIPTSTHTLPLQKDFPWTSFF